jgi:hypothetical protein
MVSMRPLRVILCTTLLAVPAPSPAEERRAAPAPSLQRVCIRGTCFDAELAVTAEERARGLMHRTALPRDRGMLFVFPQEALHRFWMKNTRIELDIIFIAGDRRIVGIAERARPCTADPCETFAPEVPAGYALEIAGGLSATYGFAVGDPVEFAGTTAPSRRPASDTR